MKPHNILMGKDDQLKLSDFGLARAFSIPLRPFTHEVVTIWYRAPELLLGAKEYSIEVDMWSIGCIFFELVNMYPLFNGQTDMEMINKIFLILGTP
jgi:cyclin-dependent kinase